jgi:hypothetical protein
MKLPGVIGALVLVAFVWGVFGLRAEPEVTQPIAFPHKTHVEQNLQCTTCHERAEKDAVAGRPPTELCLSCHGGGDGTGEIKKLQAFEKHGEIPWNRVWRLPRHVFFPHRTHVVVAKLPCQTCHGPMETLDERLHRVPRGAGAAGREDGGPDGREARAVPLQGLHHLPSLRPEQ